MKKKPTNAPKLGNSMLWRKIKKALSKGMNENKKLFCDLKK
jgi:hypothetical protein